MTGVEPALLSELEPESQNCRPLCSGSNIQHHQRCILHRRLPLRKRLWLADPIGLLAAIDHHFAECEDVAAQPVLSYDMDDAGGKG
jgi:hypothetical protein